MTDVKDGKLSDITPDANNANLGTQRGLGMLESSLRKHGAGRSILLDRQGRIIAGNKTVQQAGDIGLDELIIVKTDGKQLVAVQREDLDLTDDSTGARELAYADNRVGELDLSWNPETILADLETVDLSGLFREDELQIILAQMPDSEDWQSAFNGASSGEKSLFQQMTFTLHDDQAEMVNRALKTARAQGSFETSLNENSNGNALTRICEAFVTNYGEG